VRVDPDADEAAVPARSSWGSRGRTPCGCTSCSAARRPSRPSASQRCIESVGCGRWPCNRPDAGDRVERRS